MSELFLLAVSNPILFISLYKFVFLGYALNIIITLYFTRQLTISERLFAVLKNVLFLIIVQLIRLFAKYLNGF